MHEVRIESSDIGGDVWWRARCTCGWRTDGYNHEIPVRYEAGMHKTLTALA